MAGEAFLNGKVSTRPTEDNRFDELFGTACDVHMEMMDDNVLWIALRPKGETDEVHVTISARGKLTVVAHEA